MIKIQFEPQLQRSAAYDDGSLIGVCEYQVENNAWLITHTQVNPACRGQGIARQLVDSVVQAAAKEQIKIIPLCSYAKKILGAF